MKFGIAVTKSNVYTKISSSLLNSSSEEMCIQHSKLGNLIIKKSAAKTETAVGSQCEARALSTLSPPSPHIQLLGHLQRALTACKVAFGELASCNSTAM